MHMNISCFFVWLGFFFVLFFLEIKVIVFFYWLTYLSFNVNESISKMSVKMQI